ncbi:MAG: hypothetical protein ACLSUW_01000 [Akkermansia sp.]
MPDTAGDTRAAEFEAYTPTFITWGDENEARETGRKSYPGGGPNRIGQG